MPDVLAEACERRTKDRQFSKKYATIRGWQVVVVSQQTVASGAARSFRELRSNDSTQQRNRADKPALPARDLHYSLIVVLQIRCTW